MMRTSQGPFAMETDVSCDSDPAAWGVSPDGKVT
jgi:hypothetical protein